MLYNNVGVVFSSHIAGSSLLQNGVGVVFATHTVRGLAGGILQNNIGVIFATNTARGLTGGILQDGLGVIFATHTSRGLLGGILPDQLRVVASTHLAYTLSFGSVSVAGTVASTSGFVMGGSTFTRTVTILSFPTQGGTAVTFNAAGVLTAPVSSRRFKDNIRPLKDNFFKLFTIEPKTFSYKGSTTTDIGYMAEDFVEAGIPSMVNYDLEGQPFSLKYDRIPIYLMEIVRNHDDAIRKLKEENETLQKLKLQNRELQDKNIALESKTKDFEARLRNLEKKVGP